MASRDRQDQVGRRSSGFFEPDSHDTSLEAIEHDLDAIAQAITTLQNQKDPSLSEEIATLTAEYRRRLQATINDSASLDEDFAYYLAVTPLTEQQQDVAEAEESDSSLITILGGDRASTPTSSPTENEDQTTMPADQPTVHPIHGGQLQTIPTYDGSGNVKEFIRLVDRAKEQFTWSNEATSAAVKSKLTGEAYSWLRTKEIQFDEGLKIWCNVSLARN